MAKVVEKITFERIIFIQTLELCFRKYSHPFRPYLYHRVLQHSQRRFHRIMRIQLFSRRYFHLNHIFDKVFTHSKMLLEQFSPTKNKNLRSCPNKPVLDVLFFSFGRLKQASFHYVFSFCQNPKLFLESCTCYKVYTNMSVQKIS
jgi:hypothetical protein